MKRLLSLILTICLVFGMVGVMPSMKAQAKGVEASLEMEDAPAIKIDKIYTFDRMGNAEADINIPGEGTEIHYVKVNIPTTGDYYYVFRSTSLDCSIMRLYDKKGKMIADSAYKSNKAESAKMKLSKGSYYIGIIGCDPNPTGSVCIISKEEYYKDELRTDEPVNGNNPGEVCYASLDFRTAPLISLEKEYSFGREGFADGSIRIPNNGFFDNDIYYVKFYATKDGYYEYDFDANSYSEVIFYLFDAFGKRVLDTGDMLDGCEGGYVKLKAGVYFVGMTAWYQYSEGIFKYHKIPKPEKATLSTLTAKKKGFTAKWKKVSGASGYQIEYSTKASMEGSKKKSFSSSKTSVTISSLLASKKYYVRIRAYKIFGGVRHEYGTWSSIKTVKTKK